MYLKSMMFVSLSFLSCMNESDIDRQNLNRVLPSSRCVKPEPSNFDVQQYYASVGSKTGLQLKYTLAGIIKNHIKYSYDKCADEIIKEADQDPQNPSRVIGIYSRISIEKSSRKWNKEHVWAKSHGFQRPAAHAYSDIHHLRAELATVNSDRGNKDFENGGETISNCNGCYMTHDTWEAPDVSKGDVARMMFYMATRYDGLDSGSTQTPDLELISDLTSVGQPKFGNVCTLLKWHKLDPVSHEEMRHNDIVYSWQKNRNPFIDHPEWVEMIWGTAENCR